MVEAPARANNPNMLYDCGIAKRVATHHTTTRHTHNDLDVEDYDQPCSTAQAPPRRPSPNSNGNEMSRSALARSSRADPQKHPPARS
jgi:hypothetical protein